MVEVVVGVDGVAGAVMAGTGVIGSSGFICGADCERVGKGSSPGGAAGGERELSEYGKDAGAARVCF